MNLFGRHASTRKHLLLQHRSFILKEMLVMETPFISKPTPIMQMALPMALQIPVARIRTVTRISALDRQTRGASQGIVVEKEPTMVDL